GLLTLTFERRTPMNRSSLLPGLRAAVVALLVLLQSIGAVAPAAAATIDTNAWYVLVNRHSAKVMDAYERATAAGPATVQGASASLPVPFGAPPPLPGSPPSPRLRAAAGALLVLLRSTVAAAPAAAATIDTNAWYVLVNRHSGKVMDVYERATGDGAAIVQWAR